MLALALVLPLTCRRLPDDTATRVSFWYYCPPETKPLMQRVVRNFETAHPGLKVDLLFSTGGNAYSRKVLAALQAGRCGDVLFLHWKQLPAIAGKGVLEPLGARAAREGYDLADFYKTALDAYTMDGQLYALPLQGSTVVLFYNKNLFDKAGLPYPSDDWTWDDLTRAAQKLTDRDAQSPQIGLVPYDPASWVWSAGGDYATDDLRTLCFTNAATLAGFQFYFDLRDRYKVTVRNMNQYGEDPMGLNVFRSGRVAMEVSGPWNLAKYCEIEDFDWDVVLFPKGPAGRQTRYAGNGLVIWQKSPRKDSAWELVKHVCSRESMEILARGRQDIPTRKSVANSDAFMRVEGRKRWNIGALAKSTDPACATVRVFPHSPLWPEINDRLVENLDLALLGKLPLAEALRKTDAEARAWIDKNRQGPSTAAREQAP
jgi:multiple sugar transport system substrate-binding protein